MELDKANSNDKSMEGSAANEDLLVVLQTENGEQIALPMSALPSDFVPGDSGQIIMVESALDEQQQEIVVESSDINITSEPPATTSENFVSLQQAEPTLNNSHIINNTATTASLDNAITINSNNIMQSTEEQPTIVQIQQNIDDRPTPRTYSKSNVVKSYAPTCGPTRIYQQQSTPGTNSNHTSNQPKSSNNHNASFDISQHVNTELLDASNISHQATIIRLEQSNQQDITTNDYESRINQLQSAITQQPSAPVVVKERKPKQKRKEPLVTRPLDEEDLKVEFQIIEEQSPTVMEVDVRKRPRKEYRTKKKVKLAMEKMSQDDSIGTESMDVDVAEKEVETPRVGRRSSSRRDSSKEEPKQDIKKEETKTDEVKLKEAHCKELKKETPRRELPKRASKEKEKDKQQHENASPTKAPPQSQSQTSQQQQSPQQQTVERRTRLSNICRVATGKMYKCNDCDFETDRINNIVLHVKESCPNVSRKG